MDDKDTTLKIKGLPKFNELDYYQYKYDEALKAMTDNPTTETVKAFGDANRKLFEVQDAYRIGARLLLERNHYVIFNSQELHLL